ncbi:MAG: hypothetical protein ACREP9_22165 [Candidatus Dormibacteraceae bacterium]
MSSTQKSEHEPALDAVLKEWVVEAPLPPCFQESVWKRIARTDLKPMPGFWASLGGLVESALPRPKVAYSYLTALLLLGMAAGSLVAQKQNHRLEASLGSRYLQTIDPFQAVVPDQ